MADKLVLFRGFPAKQAYCPSPFPTKLEFRLRYARLPYRVEAGSPLVAPKGKIPYVDLSAFQDTDSGTSSYFGDSTLILRRLIGMDQIEDLNAGLSEEQKTFDLGLRALLEDKLYFYNMQERWIDDYYTHRDMVLWEKPLLIRVLLGYVLHRGISSTLHGQGTGRFTSEEIAMFRIQIWRQIDDLLAKRLRDAPKDQPFWVLGGHQPTEADATLFGFITSPLVTPSGRISKRLVKGLPSIMEYAERIHNSLFPDYEKWH